MYKNIKKLTALLLVAGAMLTFSSCSKDKNEDTPSSAGTAAALKGDPSELATMKSYIGQNIKDIIPIVEEQGYVIYYRGHDPWYYFDGGELLGKNDIYNIRDGKTADDRTFSTWLDVNDDGIVFFADCFYRKTDNRSDFFWFLQDVMQEYNLSRGMTTDRFIGYLAVEGEESGTVYHDREAFVDAAKDGYYIDYDTTCLEQGQYGDFFCFITAKDNYKQCGDFKLMPSWLQPLTDAFWDLGLDEEKSPKASTKASPLRQIAARHKALLE